MKALWRVWARVTGMFRRGRQDREMAQEFESHLQMHIDDNIRAGMSPEQARREALMKFGGMEAAKESVRETSRLMWLETAARDIRYALRGLRLNPGFAVHRRALTDAWHWSQRGHLHGCGQSVAAPAAVSRRKAIGDVV